MLQGVVGGITASIGYGLGAIASTLARALLHWRPARRTRARLWLACWLLAIVPSVVLITESAHAQRRLRQLQGLPPSLTWHTPLIMLITAALWVLILLVARAIRLGSRTLIRVLDRLLPLPVAFARGVVLSALPTTVWDRAGRLMCRLRAAADRPPSSTTATNARISRSSMGSSHHGCGGPRHRGPGRGCGPPRVCSSGTAPRRRRPVGSAAPA